jgi:hypothetical protein
LDNTKIKGIIVLLVSLFLAIYLGNAAATAQKEAIAWVVGVSAVIFLLALGKDVWLLVPFGLLCSIKFEFLPGSLSVFDIVQIAFVGFCTLLFITRRVNLTYRFGALQISVLLVLATVVQAYLRNPVGLNIFGSTTVGARPYFNFAIAFMTAFFLAGLTVPLRKWKSAVVWCLMGGFICAIINVLAYIPGLGYYAAYYFGAGTYSLTNPNNDSVVDPGAAGRNTAGVYTSQVLSRWITGSLSPFKAMIHPLWFPVLLLTVAAAMLSGFRNCVASTGAVLALGIYYWSGFKAIIGCTVLGVLGVACLAIINTMAPLPPNAQRSLSFLPGTWDESLVADAEDSSEWRFEMWKEALTSDRWIKNKVFGDGLGFTKQELDLQEAARLKLIQGLGTSGFDEQRESFLISGDYHSGPISFIRTTGYVGLVVYIVALGILAVQAHRFILITRGTEWFKISCFFCIPMVMHPLFFTLIFGAFGYDVAIYLLNAGLLLMMKKSFDADQPKAQPLPT